MVMMLRIECLTARRTAREAVAAQFPNADLSGKKDFLNSSIDKILSVP